MKTIKFASLALTLALTTLASVSLSLAAGWSWDRDAGARMRGEYGGTPRSSVYSYGVATQSYAYPITATPSSTDYAYRSFSYAPAPATNQIKAGDVVTVVKPSVTVKVGNQTLTTLGQGQKLTVTEVRGPWLGVNAAGKSGWIQASDAAPAK